MKEMMVHHSIMICGIFTIMQDKIYGNFMLYALNMEVNSFFLHVRSLLLMCKKRDTTAFKLVSALNILVSNSFLPKKFFDGFLDKCHS